MQVEAEAEAEVEAEAEAGSLRDAMGYLRYPVGSLRDH